MSIVFADNVNGQRARDNRKPTDTKSDTVTSLAIPNAVMVGWTFETNTPADLSNSATSPTVAGEAGLQVSGAVFSGTHASAGADWTTPAGNGSANSFSANEWAIGDYYQAQFSTTGYSGISISWDQTRSSTGPTDFKVQYSTDGSVFTDLPGGGYTVLENTAGNGGTWNATTLIPAYTVTRDLSSVTALNNDSSIFIRLVATVAGTATGGTGRVDNFTVNGTASTAAGVGISGRVLTSEGRGITNAVVTIMGNSLSAPRNAVTGRGGSYIFDDLEPGETYIVTVRARRFMFSNPSQVISIVDNVSDADFVADGVASRGR